MEIADRVHTALARSRRSDVSLVYPIHALTVAPYLSFDLPASRRPQAVTDANSSVQQKIMTLSLGPEIARAPITLADGSPRSRFQVGRDLALANGVLERGMIAFGLVCVGYREIARRLHRTGRSIRDNR